ncbi:hypothetical protein ZWY2020_031067 [Hordeum vulgare]|nr:hypothetical protein ZWY2020_031067 [Hordeum vulgare]
MRNALAHLPRELPALDLKVSDALRPRYRRCIALLHEALRSDALRRCSQRLRPIVGRYERRAMRAMVCSVRSLRASRHRRVCGKLSLEFFAFSTSATINRLVVDAVDSWGVEDLEVVAKSTEPITHLRPVYKFPVVASAGSPASPPSKPQARKLLAPPLEGSPRSPRSCCGTCPAPPAAVYEGVVTACPQLQVLHLVSCSFDRIQPVGWCSTRPCQKSESLSLTAVHDRQAPLSAQARASLPWMPWFCCARTPTSLALRIISFCGLLGQRCGLPNLKNQFSLMPNLKKLRVADAPSSWDVSWPRVLIQAAPLLETSMSMFPNPSANMMRPDHQNVSSCLQQPSSSSSSWQRHRHLKELVVVGFQSMSRIHHQVIYLVRFVVDTSTALRRVAVFKHGHVEDKGDRGLGDGEQSKHMEQRGETCCPELLCDTPN